MSLTKSKLPDLYAWSNKGGKCLDGQGEPEDEGRVKQEHQSQYTFKGGQTTHPDEEPGIHAERVMPANRDKQAHLGEILQQELERRSVVKST